MMIITDWYWQYGINRTGEYQLDASWLDAVSRLENKRSRILDSMNQKTCLALWGMSQTGKSTLLSQYLDGRRANGNDSALTWSNGQNVRFLAINQNQMQAANVVFNPYNAGMDASGVAARYTLRNPADGTVNNDYPVEMKVMTHCQFLHALARGYVSECQQARQIVTSQFVLDSLHNNANPLSRSAFEKMQDALEVIELMKNGTQRFVSLFQDDGWMALRRQCLSARGTLSSDAECVTFIKQVFWDGNRSMSELYDNVIQFLVDGNNGLGAWSGKRILMTMEVAAKLLNIDTNANLADVAQATVASWEIEGDCVYLSMGNNLGNQISGRQFGYLQALCKEIIVPVRSDRLGNRGALSQFLNNADLLDLPGLSRVANDGHQAALRDVAAMEESDILKYVLKEGRTQSYVYNYANAYNVDAFMVLVKSHEYVGKPQILDDGILSWLRSYDAEWQFHTPAPMPLFIDITFFGTHVNNAWVAHTPNRWNQVVDWVTTHFSISDRNTARYFLTNYPHLPVSRIDEIGEDIINEISNDRVFTQSLGFARDDIDAVFNDNGGVDRMLAAVIDSVDADNRRDKCKGILRDSTNQLIEFITNCLPQDANIALQQMQASIDARVQRVQNGNVPSTELSNELKMIFRAKPEWFDVIPMAFHNNTPDQRKVFYKQQLENWCTGILREISSINDPIERQEIVSIVQAIKASVDANIFALIDRAFSGPESIFSLLNNPSDGNAARLTFSLVFSNVLRTGSPYRNGPALNVALDDMIRGNVLPCRVLQIDPLVNRLRQIRNQLQVGVRQPQPGDLELEQIRLELV